MSCRAFWPVLILLALFALLAAAYSAALPAGEGPDEPEHYGYVDALRRGLDPATLAGQERAQPPLYYALAALLTTAVHPPDWERDALPVNAWWGFPAPAQTPDNKNHFLHTAVEAPYRAGFQAARLAATCFGLLAVLGVWLAGREALPPRGARLAALIAAFTPQFIQISAQVSNDSAVAGMSALALWALLRIARRGLTLRRALLTGGLLGLAALTKTSALVLLLAAPLAIWIGRRGARRQWLALAAALFGAAALVGGWWYGRGLLLTGDPFGTAPHAEMPWALAGPADAGALASRLPWTLAGYWANFGWGNIWPGPWYYAGVLIIVLAALRGWWRGRGANRAGGALWLIPAAVLALAFLALLGWMRSFALIDGRLLFPALGAVSLLLAGGLVSPGNARLRPVTAGVTAVFLGGSSVILAGATLYPAFHMTGFLPGGAGLPPLQGEPVRYGAAVRLLGYDFQETIESGTLTEATLCWETLQTPAADLAFAFHIVGAEDALIAARDSHHGLGRYPASTWTPGVIFCDRFALPVAAEVPPAGVFGVEIAVYDPASGERLPALDAEGTPRPDDFVGAVRSAAPVSPPADTPLLEAPYRFGDLAELAAVAVIPGQDALTVRLAWHVLGQTAIDYTIFLHAAPPEGGPPLAQGDRPPSLPTRFWRPGEWVTETLTLPLTEGDYRLLLGLYNPADGARQVVTQGGVRLPDDAVFIAIDADQKTQG